MKNRTAVCILLAAMTVMILDSRCASESALAALELCLKTLIPNLFPFFVLSSLLIPQLGNLRLPFLSGLLGIPDGSEGIFLLGCAGGFPVGAACIARAVETGGIPKRSAERMLGFCSFCGPSFLFGVIASVLSLPEALTIFLIQLETALLTAALRRGHAEGRYNPPSRGCSIPEAVRSSLSSMATVCAWVILAGICAGFLERWIFPLLPRSMGVLLTGLMELTNGTFSLDAIASRDLRFLLTNVFVCFGGVSVLLQIGGLAAPAGLSMGPCILQKTFQALLGALLASLFLRFGIPALLLPLLFLIGKIAVEIPGGMVYNSRRKEGI